MGYSCRHDQPGLAGEFLTKFIGSSFGHSNRAQPDIGQARFDAVRELGQGEYGAKALAFMLAGNGALSLCVPNLNKFMSEGITSGNTNRSPSPHIRCARD